jgi:DNA replicative helicase MCM subunit Mcm2 (Cdc46/Mcm family)
MVDLTSKHNPDKTNEILHNFVTKLGVDVQTLTTGLVELYVLSRQYDIPIYIYNDDQELIYLFHDGLKKNIDKKYTSIDMKKNSINIRFNYIPSKKVPNEISSIYYK